MDASREIQGSIHLCGVIQFSMCPEFWVHISFDNGLLFWEALQKSHPDLVVLEVMLPGMDGIELLQKMRRSAICTVFP